MIDWRHWHNEPYLVGGIIVLGWLYALLTGPLRTWISGTPATPFPRGHAIRFYAALVIFYLAVGSPLDQIGERFLLTAHMVQHQLLIYGAGLLFLLGLPSWLVGTLTSRPSLRRLLGFLSNPIVCGAVYTFTLTVWHAPALYDWALQDKAVHVLEHVMFFGAALFFWWPVASPSREFPPRPFGVQIVYLLGVTIGMTPLFAFLAFSDNILYPTYEYAPRIVANLDPAQDQLLGAAVMKLGGMAVTFVVLIVVFYRWYLTSERGAPVTRRPAKR